MCVLNLHAITTDVLLCVLVPQYLASCPKSWLCSLLSGDDPSNENSFDERTKKSPDLKALVAIVEQERQQRAAIEVELQNSHQRNKSLEDRLQHLEQLMSRLQAANTPPVVLPPQTTHVQQMVMAIERTPDKPHVPKLKLGKLAHMQQSSNTIAATIPCFDSISLQQSTANDAPAASARTQGKAAVDVLMSVPSSHQEHKVVLADTAPQGGVQPAAFQSADDMSQSTEQDHRTGLSATTQHATYQDDAFTGAAWHCSSDNSVTDVNVDELSDDAVLVTTEPSISWSEHQGVSDMHLHSPSSSPRVKGSGPEADRDIGSHHGPEDQEQQELSIPAQLMRGIVGNNKQQAASSEEPQLYSSTAGSLQLQPQQPAVQTGTFEHSQHQEQPHSHQQQHDLARSVCFSDVSSCSTSSISTSNQWSSPQHAGYRHLGGRYSDSKPMPRHRQRKSATDLRPWELLHYEQPIRASATQATITNDTADAQDQHETAPVKCSLDQHDRQQYATRESCASLESGSTAPANDSPGCHNSVDKCKTKAMPVSMAMMTPRAAARQQWTTTFRKTSRPASHGNSPAQDHKVASMTNRSVASTGVAFGQRRPAGTTPQTPRGCSAALGNASAHASRQQHVEPSTPAAGSAGYTTPCFARSGSRTSRAHAGSSLDAGDSSMEYCYGVGRTYPSAHGCLSTPRGTANKQHVLSMAPRSANAVHDRAGVRATGRTAALIGGSSTPRGQRAAPALTGTANAAGHAGERQSHQLSPEAVAGVNPTNTADTASDSTMSSRGGPSSHVAVNSSQAAPAKKRLTPVASTPRGARAGWRNY